MALQAEFAPPKRNGLIFLGGVIMIFTAAVVVLFFLASNATHRSGFWLALSAGILCLLPLTFLLYRAYALYTTSYSLTRNGLELKWGMRKEVLPLNAIEWVRPLNEMGFRIPGPLINLPGVFFGNRQVENLGKLEFLASHLQQALLVATRRTVYIISPENARSFMSTFTTVNELGSLDALAEQSVRPKTLLMNIWQDKIARRLFLSSAVLLLVLLGLTTILAVQVETVSWFGDDQVPSVRLFLLPVINGLFWLVDLISGVFFYQRDDKSHMPTYALWGASSLASVIFIISYLQL